MTDQLTWRTQDNKQQHIQKIQLPQQGVTDILFMENTDFTHMTITEYPLPDGVKIYNPYGDNPTLILPYQLVEKYCKEHHTKLELPISVRYQPYRRQPYAIYNHGIHVQNTMPLYQPLVTQPVVLHGEKDNVWKEFMRAFVSKKPCFTFYHNGTMLKYHTQQCKWSRTLIALMLKQQHEQPAYITTHDAYMKLYNSCISSDIPKTQEILTKLQHRLHHQLFVLILFIKMHVTTERCQAQIKPQDIVRTEQKYDIHFRVQTLCVIKQNLDTLIKACETLIQADYVQFAYLASELYNKLRITLRYHVKFNDVKIKVFKYIEAHTRDLNNAEKQQIDNLLSQYSYQLLCNKQKFYNIQRYADLILIHINDQEKVIKIQRGISRILLDTALQPLTTVNSN